MNRISSHHAKKNYCTVVLATVLFTLVCQAKGQPAAPKPADETYLKEMPDPERVFNDMKLPDPRATAERQWGAFHQLKSMMVNLRPHITDSPSDEEARLQKAYMEAMSRIRESKFNPGHYESDTSFRDELFRRYFSADWQAHYRSIEGGQRPQSEQAKASPAWADPLEQLRSFQKAWLGPDILERIRNPRYTFAYAMAMLVVVCVFVSFRRPKLHGPNLLKLRGGGMKSYKLHYATGAAYGVGKGHSETTTVSGNQYSVSSSSTHHVHDQFQISVPGGKDHSVQLTDVNLAVAEKQLISAVWAIPRGKNWGAYVLIHNHTTGVWDAIRRPLRRMIFPSRLGVLPLLIVAFSLSGLADSKLDGTDVLVTLALIFFGVYIPYAIVRRMVGSIRYRHFYKKSIPRLVKELEKLAGYRKFAEPAPVATA